MIVELNIGLNVNSRLADNSDARREDRANWALNFIRSHFNLLGSRRAMSATEDTLIARVSVGSAGAAFQANIYRIAEALRQDCIAVWNATDWYGELIGPNAAAWGEFNPEYFLTYSGKSAVVFRKSPQTIDALSAELQRQRDREASTYTGHGASTGGLQGHSMGDEYPYLVHGVADRWEAPTEYVVMDTRTGNRSRRHPTYMAAYIELTSLKCRNMMHG